MCGVLMPREATAGLVASIPPYRDNALQPQRAGVAEDGVAIPLKVLAEAQRLGSSRAGSDTSYFSLPGRVRRRVPSST
jgi:hypothetical protein